MSVAGWFCSGKGIALWLLLVVLMSLLCGEEEEQAMDVEVRCNALQVCPWRSGRISLRNVSQVFGVDRSVQRFLLGQTTQCL